MEDIDKLIEAALFMSSKPLSMNDLLRVASQSNSLDVRQALKRIAAEYVARGSWIEIVQMDRSYVMRLKPDKTGVVATFAQETELSKRALRALAVISRNEGILQSKVVRTLGASAYDGITELMEKHFITSEPKGHSKILRLAPKFKTYFGEQETMQQGEAEQPQTG